MARVRRDPKSLLLEVFGAALAAANPQAAVRLNLPARPAGQVVVIACGKAAPAMLRGLSGWGAVTGVAVTTAGQTLPAHPGIRWLEAAHPLPDQRSLAAGQMMLEALRGLTSDDLVLCLISGGSSALCCVPNQVTLQEKTALTSALLRSGASIQEINTVRKHLSGIKGGRLAAAAQPARLEALIVSDVVGDQISAIGSGMTAPDPSSVADALEVLRHHGIPAPAVLTEIPMTETPKHDDPIFERVTNRVILSNREALRAAQHLLMERGWHVTHIDDAVTGDSRSAATGQAALVTGSGTAALSGGETTVQVSGGGRGGRNLEFLLQLVTLDAGLYALSADSDGIDGSSNAAGAIVTPDSLRRARALQLEPLDFQRRNDAHGFFAALGDLIFTGATGTNVGDIRVILNP